MLRRRFRHTVVLLVQCAIVLSCVAVTTVAAASVQERQLRAATEERVLAVAQSLAELDQVQEAIGAADAAEQLQPLADLIMQSSGVDYVVITDEQGIRLTHPIPGERGLPVSTDATAVLGGEPFLGTETGTLGPTLRAKVPVYRDGQVVGTASVGILEQEIAADQRASLLALAPWVLAAIVVGIAGAALLSQSVNRKVRRLESEVAELEVQRRISRALREQTHEFRTQVHAIYGLVESGESTAALDYIATLAPVSDSQGIGADIADPRVRAVLAASAADLLDGGGSLELDPVSSVATGVLGDDDLTVIANLVRNATEATDRQGHVQVALHGDESEVEIVVADDGPGISAEAVPHLFRHGFTTKSEPDDGTQRGVGLALVMRVVTDRGGHVDVGRSPAGGARFEVRLPTRPAQGAPPHDAPKQVAGTMTT